MPAASFKTEAPKMDSRLLRRKIQDEVREMQRRKRAAVTEGEALDGAGAAECRGEARVLREIGTRLGVLLAHADTEETSS